MKDNTDVPSTRPSINELFAKFTQAVLRYSVVLFTILVTAVYGFALYRITSAHDVVPTQDQIDAKLEKAATPRIDQKIVDQMQSLQDNSVNVRTLFDQARSNPFQE